MKRILYTAFLLFVFNASYAESEEVYHKQKVAEAYQQGLQAAAQGLKNLQQWKKGKGDPKMVQAYQDGERAVAQVLENQKNSSKS